MKKLFSIITLFTIACGILFAADKSNDPNDKLSLVGAHGSKYTFVFDITNESNERVSFFVMRHDNNIVGSEPEVWHEISVPPKSSDIYTYSVKKGTEDRCNFQWIQEYHFVKSSGSAKNGYGNAKSKILIKENLDALLEKEDWKEPFHMGVLSTFSAPDYQTWKEADEEYKKEHCRYVAYRTRNINTNEISNKLDGYRIYKDEPKEEVLKRHKGWLEEKGLVITDSFEADTMDEAFAGIQKKREYEKPLLGQWEGEYQGAESLFTLRSTHYYRLELGNGAWEQYWWTADPEFINFQIYTTKEKVFSKYTVKGDEVTFAGYGTFKLVKYYKVTEDYNKKKKASPYSYRIKNAPREAADYVNFSVGYKDGDKLITAFSSSCKEKIEELLTAGSYTEENEIIILNSNPQE